MLNIEFIFGHANAQNDMNVECVIRFFPFGIGSRIMCEF